MKNIVLSLFRPSFYSAFISPPSINKVEQEILTQQQTNLLRDRTIFILVSFSCLNIIWMFVDAFFLSAAFFKSMFILRIGLLILLFASLLILAYKPYKFWMTLSIYILPMIFFFFSYQHTSSLNIEGMNAGFKMTYQNIPLVIIGLIALMPTDIGQSILSFFIILFISLIAYNMADDDLNNKIIALWAIATSGLIAILASLTQYHFFATLTTTGFRDPLTGALRRKAGEMLLTNQLALAKRTNADYSVAMVDIDHFKKVNDDFGHLYGDHVLQNITRIIQKRKRETDIFLRWGGEEFILGLQNTGDKSLKIALDRIFGEGFGRLPDGKPLTISGGIASMRDDKAKTLQNLIELADNRMYQAKQAGRNQIIDHLGVIF